MFQFKQFTIKQDRTPMKVGTDGVLLGAWADLKEANHILDIGTGTGLIALMAAQRNPNASIDALEIEFNACLQAQENIYASSWAKRIQLIPKALQDYSSDIKYNSIVCNPPFFHQSTKTPNHGRTLARHNETLLHTELIQYVAKLLSPQGNFCVILPTNEALSMIEYAQQHQLYPSHITYILPTPEKPAKRYLIKFMTKPEILFEDKLIIELSRHKYSKEYIELTKDFYLHIES